MHLKLIRSQRDTAYSGPHLQMPLKACFDIRLNNPFLNAIYKKDITFTERWYLESRKRLLGEEWEHPILDIVINDLKLRRRLVESTVIDGSNMRSVLANPDKPEYHVSAGVNLGRLQRWCGFFVSLDFHSS